MRRQIHKILLNASQAPLQAGRLRLRRALRLAGAAGAMLCGLCGSLRAQAPVKVELQQGWKLSSAAGIPAGAEVSREGFDTKSWRRIARMPATVLEVLQEDGVYPNLYFGMNLLTEPPQDLYRQDWWYRTSFRIPPGRQTYWLEFPGINYRAEIWLNGSRLATTDETAGMYVAHTYNVTALVHADGENVLAVKVTPERKIPDVDGVELADSWHDWLEWEHLGSRAPKSDHYKEGWTADRNAGVWKPVTLHAAGAVTLAHPMVDTELPLLPELTRADLTVYTTATNSTDHAVTGVLQAKILRSGNEVATVRKEVKLQAGESREVALTPREFPQLALQHPELWWPYTMGEPRLYDLAMAFTAEGVTSDVASMRFGIRKVTQHRDNDLRFSKTREGNFYLKINGRDFHARGANYTPDLLFRRDPQRDEETIRYVKDLGLNMLRWESKIADEHMFELADEAGIPVMAGWMCCSKWEQWGQWSEEDQRVARESLRSQVLMLRQHSSLVLWSNGSDGRPPEPLLADYRKILAEAHWPNAVVDTDSNGNTDGRGHQLWDGIGMTGVDRWHPPSYWFDERYPAASGSTAEYGDNEVIPPYESLKKFLPQDKLWPINEAWSFHAGAHEGANQLSTIRKVVEKRYGPSHSAEEFARKAQLAHYETTRAQFEDWAANGWATHKLEMYWMLNNHWPSFFGHLYDYYFEPGGAYFGAKKGLRPLSVVFDYFASGDHSKARIAITNEHMEPQHGLRVRVRFYDLAGRVRFDRTVSGRDVPAQDAVTALEVPRPRTISSTYFVRCELFDAGGARVADNVYWQSTTLDDFADPANDDDDVPYTQKSWSTFLALNTMPQAPLEVSAHANGGGQVSVTLHNAGTHVAFFERASVLDGQGGAEVLPIRYSDNYVTVFPGESVTLDATVGDRDAPAAKRWVRVEGYNTPAQEVPIA